MSAQAQSLSAYLHDLADSIDPIKSELESTVGHEQYHLLQAQAVRNDPGFPNV